MSQGTKRCYRCKDLLPLDRFARCAGRSDGLQTMCRGCRTEYMREHRSANPSVREYDRTVARARYARDPFSMRDYEWRRRVNGGQIIPFTEAELNARLSMFAGCWICGGVAGQVDHVKPLSRGGAHALCNLRPICEPCNVAKATYWPLHRIPMLTAKVAVGEPDPPRVHFTRQ